MNFKDIFPENILSHHGYLFVGDVDEIEKRISDFLTTDLDISQNANPDFCKIEKDSFGIDDVRGVIEKASLKSFSDKDDSKSKKIFFIKTNSIGIDAQNSFLKILEEPPAKTHFFIISPQNTFLPTFLSRVQVFDFGTGESVGLNILEKTLPERFEIVAKLCKEISDEKKQKQDAIGLVNQIERTFLEKCDISKYKKELLACQNARNMILQRGAMVKMILEDLVMRF